MMLSFHGYTFPFTVFPRCKTRSETRNEPSLRRIQAFWPGQEAWQESTGRLAATLEESFNGVQQKCLGLREIGVAFLKWDTHTHMSHI